MYSRNKNFGREGILTQRCPQGVGNVEPEMEDFETPDSHSNLNKKGSVGKSKCVEGERRRRRDEEEGGGGSSKGG